jgi:hypothetical protein
LACMSFAVENGEKEEKVTKSYKAINVSK